MAQLLAETASISTTQWIIIALIISLIIAYPILVFFRNKSEKERFDKLSKDIKVGDKILTSSGTYGEIIAIDERQNGKVLTLKTGDDDHVGYLSVDILTIYSVFRDQPTEPIVEEVKQEVKQTVEEVKEEKEAPKEVKKPVVKKEKTAQPKSAQAKSSKGKKSTK